MATYTNFTELFNAIENDVYKSMSRVGERILGEMDDNIMEIVYKPHEDSSEFPAREYTTRSGRKKEFNGGFIGSWVLYDNVYHMNVVVPKDLFEEPDRFYNDFYANEFIGFTIKSDPSLMELDPPSHGRLLSNEDKSYMTQEEIFQSSDRRDRMAEIIQEGTEYDYYVKPTSKNYYGSGDNWWTRPRDYFYPTVEFIDSNFKSLVSSQFAKNNIKFKIGA